MLQKGQSIVRLSCYTKPKVVLMKLRQKSLFRRLVIFAGILLPSVAIIFLSFYILPISLRNPFLNKFRTQVDVFFQDAFMNDSYHFRNIYTKITGNIYWFSPRTQLIIQADHSDLYVIYVKVIAWNASNMDLHLDSFFGQNMQFTINEKIPVIKLNSSVSTVNGNSYPNINIDINNETLFCSGDILQLGLTSPYIQKTFNANEGSIIKYINVIVRTCDL